MEYIVRIKNEVRHRPDPISPWDFSYRTSHGSGVLISPTHILTNRHVMDDYVTVEIFHPSTQTYLTFKRVLRYSFVLDLCLIETDRKEYPFASIGPTPEIGDMIHGYGFGGSSSLNPRKDSGIVSRTLFVPIETYTGHINMIETQMSTIPGDSGSPAFNDANQVIGIRHASSPKTSYFIPSFLIKLFLSAEGPSLVQEKREVNGFINFDNRLNHEAPEASINVDDTLGYTGVDIGTHDNAVKRSYLPTLKIGDIVTHVDDEPVILGTLKYSDLISKIEGKPSLITSYTPITSYLIYKKVGDKVNFRIERDGQKITVPITVMSFTSFWPTDNFIRLNTTYIVNPTYAVLNWIADHLDINVIYNIIASFIKYGRLFPIIVYSEVSDTMLDFCPVLDESVEALWARWLLSEPMDLVIFYQGTEIRIPI